MALSVRNFVTRCASICVVVRFLGFIRLTSLRPSTSGHIRIAWRRRATKRPSGDAGSGVLRLATVGTAIGYVADWSLSA